MCAGDIPPPPPPLKKNMPEDSRQIDIFPYAARYRGSNYPMVET